MEAIPNFSGNLPEKIRQNSLISSAVCMASIHFGFLEIAAGFSDIVMIGGMEHMTRVPMFGPYLVKGAISPNPCLSTDPA